MGGPEDYARFRRLLLHGHPDAVLEAAGRLEDVPLVDAIRIVRVLAERDDARFARAAARLAARITIARGLDADASREVLSLAVAMEDDAPGNEVRLRRYCDA